MAKKKAKGRKFVIEGGQAVRFQLFVRPVGPDDRLSSMFQLKRKASALADNLRKSGYEVRVLKARGGWQVWQWPASRR